MPRDFGQCQEEVDHKRIVLDDKGSVGTAVLVNAARRTCLKVRVDDCVIRSGVRCDWLVIRTDGQHEYFVELKGSDVKHAIEQLEASMKQLSTDPQKQAKTCAVVSSRCPLTGSDITLAQIKFKKLYGAHLIIRNKYLEITVP